MRNQSRRLALISASLILLALATCGYSPRSSTSTDRGAVYVEVYNATVHNVMLKDARDMRTIAHLFGGEKRCIVVISTTPFNFIAFATSGTGLSPNRVTYSPPINPSHSRAWDWRITTFGVPETGPLLQARRPCAVKRA